VVRWLGGARVVWAACWHGRDPAGLGEASAVAARAWLRARGFHAGQIRQIYETLLGPGRAPVGTGPDALRFDVHTLSSIALSELWSVVTGQRQLAHPPPEWWPELWIGWGLGLLALLALLALCLWQRRCIRQKSERLCQLRHKGLNATGGFAQPPQGRWHRHAPVASAEGEGEDAGEGEDERDHHTADHCDSSSQDSASLTTGAAVLGAPSELPSFQPPRQAESSEGLSRGPSGSTEELGVRVVTGRHREGGYVRGGWDMSATVESAVASPSHTDMVNAHGLPAHELIETWAADNTFSSGYGTAVIQQR
jgi:hypothetical protein